MVYCLLGVHRSVSMAEALARRARGWGGVSVRVEHLDLEGGWGRWRGLEREGGGEGRGE